MTEPILIELESKNYHPKATYHAKLHLDATTWVVWAEPVHVTKKLKKRKTEPKQWQTGPDHPRCDIKMRFCMVGGLWVVVLTFKFDQNRLSHYQAFRGQNLGSCMTFANGL